MINERFTIKRADSEADGVETLSDVGIVRITYSPIRDVSSDMGGAVGTTLTAYQYTAGDPDVDLRDGDVLENENGNQFRIVTVYRFTSGFRSVQGVFQDASR